MGHINTVWNIPLCQITGGVSLKNILHNQNQQIECPHCSSRFFSLSNKHDFYISADKSIYLFPIVRNATPAALEDGQQLSDYVIIDDHDQNIGIPASEYDTFLKRYLDWRVNK